MSNPDPTPQAPAVVPAMPWYQSKVITAFVTIVVSQSLAWLTRKFAIDVTAYGISIPDVVSVVLNGLSAVAVAYGWAGRAATAPVTLTKAKAATINASAPPTVQPPGDTQ
jgi:hypothetical protein